MLHQVIEERKSRLVDEGIMGFHDYVKVFDISFEDFVNEITKKYNRHDIEVISISYPNDKKAVIAYRDKLKTIEEWEKIFDTSVMNYGAFPPNTNRKETLFTEKDFLEHCKRSTVKFSEPLLKALK